MRGESGIAGGAGQALTSLGGFLKPRQRADFFLFGFLSVMLIGSGAADLDWGAAVGPRPWLFLWAPRRRMASCCTIRRMPMQNSTSTARSRMQYLA